MKPTCTWILIADAGRARVLESRGPGKGLRPVAAMTSEADLPATHDLVTDRQARAFERGNPTRHAIEPKTDPRDQLKAQHLADIARRVEQQHLAGAFDRLVVVAPPHALGVLRGAIGDRLRAVVRGEIAKDLTKVPDHEVAAHLADVIRL